MGDVAQEGLTAQGGTMLRPRIAPEPRSGEGAEPLQKHHRRLTTGKWWRPIFIVLVSLVTVADQTFYFWLLLKYAMLGAQRPASMRCSPVCRPSIHRCSGANDCDSVGLVTCHALKTCRSMQRYTRAQV
jgi:hypothetical protein